MVTKLDRPVRREVRIGEKPYVITISPDRLRVAVKGSRKGHELLWEEIIGIDTTPRTPASPGRDDLDLDDDAPRPRVL